MFEGHTKGGFIKGFDVASLKSRPGFDQNLLPLDQFKGETAFLGQKLGQL